MVIVSRQPPFEAVRFPYLPRVLELPRLVGEAAFDEARRARTRGAALWRITVPSGRLELWGHGRIAPPPRPCYWSYREVRGCVLTRWHAPVPVRLELVPWSEKRCALGLCIAAHPPPGSSDAAYRETGSAALGELARQMDGWALVALDELEAELRKAS